jgi:hypothetical protein
MRYTDWTWVSVAIQLLIVEAYALITGHPPLTASLRHGAERWMLWPAVFGALSGHFFGTRVVNVWWAPLCATPLVAVVLYRDFFVRDLLPPNIHMEVFLVFLALGAALWGVRN